MAETTIRHELTSRIIQRLDMVRRLIEAEPIDCRLALAGQLVRRCADDVCALATTRRFPIDLDPPRERRASVGTLLAFGATVAFAGGVAVFLLASAAVRWL